MASRRARSSPQAASGLPYRMYMYLPRGAPVFKTDAHRRPPRYWCTRARGASVLKSDAHRRPPRHLVNTA